MMYKLYKTTFGEEWAKISYEDGSVKCIPFDPANTDYQAYLKWVEEGNQPLPPDET